MKKTLLLIITIVMIIFPYRVVNAESKTFTRGVVTGNGVSVRTGPSTGNALVKTDTGSGITLSRPESVEVIGSENGWYKIQFLYSGFIYTGYISSQYVTTKTVSIDDNYKNTLRSKGFPESYVEKLAILHALHPNWDFKVSGPNLNFNDVVNGEAYPVNKNLIQSSNASLRSTEDGAYVNGNYTQYGTGWYAASKQTIGYFIDPRNFLNEGHVFMFEALDYSSSSQDSATIQNMLNGSFMSGNVNYNNQTFSFANIFLEAGRQNNVSPIHLASRVLLEQGKGGSVLTLGNGYNGNYVGYYNFFNVGASGNNDYDIIMNGLSYAKNKGWNNQYPSIVGGASTIGNNYIARGQVTNYYEKFNTITPSYYTNQYMQNVKAPYSEAYSTYTSYYNAGLMESSFVFKIPVYSNMPEATTLSTTENGTNTLSSLSVSNCNLNPSFTSSASNYTCKVDSTVNSVEVSANKTSVYSTVKGTGTYNLTNNNTTITITVTAANGNSRNYVITVNRVGQEISTPNDIVSSMGYNNNNGIISKINIGTDVNNILSNIRNRFPTATVSMKDKDGNNKTTGLIATNDKLSITNNKQTKEYSVVIYGDTDGNGKIDIIDLLKVQKNIKKASMLSGNYVTAADTNKDGTIDISDLLKVQKQIKGVSTIEQ